MWLYRTDVLPMLAIVGGGAIGASLTFGLLLAPNDPVRAPVQATSTPTAVRPARSPNAPPRAMWSPDGQWIVYQSDGSGESQVYVTPFQERAAAFSPDGRWLAYVSNESGQDEIYVQPYPGPGP